MMPQPRFGKRRFDMGLIARGRCAVSLWEVALGIVAACWLIAGLQQASFARMEHARIDRTSREMTAILAACRQYASLHAAWPSWEQLLEVMPQAPQSNVWGKVYVLKEGAMRLWVEALVPDGRGGWKSVRMCAVRGSGMQARLLYEKRKMHAP